MTGSLKDQTVLAIGRGSGLARAIALAAQDAGAQVIAAGRDHEMLSAAYAGEPGISTETVDLTDEASIAALGERPSRFRFAHGGRHEVGRLALIDSYHCSRYNTNTGRLTVAMFESVIAALCERLG